jgi:hypothetical protein
MLACNSDLDFLVTVSVYLAEFRISCLSTNTWCSSMYLKTIYFQVKDEYHQETDGMTILSPFSPVRSNTYMGNFENVALQ